MTENHSAARPAPDNQTAQRQLIEEGLRLPGVAEALAVYGSAERYLRPMPHTSLVIRFATSGNA